MDNKYSSCDLWGVASVCFMLGFLIGSLIAVMAMTIAR